MKKHVIVIGSGFAGLSAACFLAKAGYDVTVLEKNSTPGGRARVFSEDGFTFDMGPSWYWMPDVFERFFNSFGKKVSDYYSLVRLDPSYQVFTKNGRELIPAGFEKLKHFFDQRERNGGKKLGKFLSEAKIKYETGMQDMVYKPAHSYREFMNWRMLRKAFRIRLFTPFHHHVRKYFSDPLLIQLMEFPVLFLGAKPLQTPALYSLMNYADMELGTWYPQGGMGKIVEAMAGLAQSLGVKFKYDTEVTSVQVENRAVSGVLAGNGKYTADGIVAGADYHHVEQQLLPDEQKKYTEKYWEKQILAPSCLIWYLGLSKRVPGLEHHNLFFDADFNRHAEEIYDNPQWPHAPLFYVCCPSKTDATVAPAGCENLFVLIPVASGLSDDEDIRARYYGMIMDRLEKHIGEPLREYILYKKSYANRDFVSDYNSYKGNAYGLANTLYQTAFMKPSMVNPNIQNLVYAGQLTVPGPGIPPSIISGEIAAKELVKRLA